jgi:hypothetical protein
MFILLIREMAVCGEVKRVTDRQLPNKEILIRRLAVCEISPSRNPVHAEPGSGVNGWLITTSPMRGLHTLRLEALP